MADSPQIVTRDAFAEVLGEARQRVAQYDAADAPLIRQIADQLDDMARETADGRTPDDEACDRINLGTLAARNLEESDPALADRLEELDYAYRRYPLLPDGPARRRRGILQVWTGRESFRKLIFEPGAPRTVGSANADYVVHAEPDGGQQFQLVWDGLCAHVVASDPHKVTIGGASCWYGEMAHGGWMTAGTTSYRFHAEDRTPPLEPPEPTPASQAALARFAALRDAGCLYAVIDAARSERALQLATESVDPLASLYDGEPGRALDDVAPYLVQLRRDSDLLERLVAEGWGRGWGLFLESPAEFDAVRRHLRRFLMVELEGESRRVYFRFYDPRVMQTFADAITPEQRADLLQVVDAIHFEGDAGAVRTLARA